MSSSAAIDITNDQLAHSDTNILNDDNLEFDTHRSAELNLQRRLQMTEDLAQHGRFSIDLSLELERQLNMESPPASSSCDVAHTVPNEEQDGDKPDPDVLAHIVTHMRKSLADMTKERDEMVEMLAKANTRDANTKDALQLMTEKAISAGEELDIARKKIKEDEEQIVLLRAKVEESRRGLMRLQTESKRQSVVPMDSRTCLTLPGFGSSPPSRRTSFTLLTGSSGHKRISSFSDTELMSSHRSSGMFGQQLLPTSDLFTTTNTESLHIPDSTSLAGAATVDSEELETLRKELQSVKAELATVKHDLIEAIEAMEASDTCVKTLRGFIADNNVGADGADGASRASKLPSPPTVTTSAEGPDRAKLNGGWGFKLWGVDSPLISSMPNMPFSTSVAAASPLSPVNSTSTLPPAPVMTATPFSRKLGGFFSRSSQSSNMLTSPLQTNAAGVQLPLHAQSQRDSSNSFSDTSSMAEPISPGSDLHGLGAGPGSYFSEVQEGIVLKDVRSLDGVDAHALSIQDKDGIASYDPPMTLSSSGSVDLDGLR